MAPLDEVQFQGRVATSPLTQKYGQTMDRQSAHEIITARLAAARELAAQDAIRGGVSPTTSDGLNTMTPAEQRREIARQAREMAARRVEADRLRRAQQREDRAAARSRDRMVSTGVRTAGRVLTSRAGQNLLRGIFDTLRRVGK
jgi:hypothetical protein